MAPSRGTGRSRLLMIGVASTELLPDERALLAERPPGGVCLFGRNVTDRHQAADLVAELRTVAGADLSVAVDQEGGGVVRLRDVPYPAGAMSLGAADDVNLTRRVAAATGRGLRSVGVNVDFAPVADVNTNPNNPVIADRAFGGDPAHVARHVTSFIGGLQEAGVAAVAKHFPGHGDVDVDSHLGLPTLRADEERLGRVELAPFVAAVDAGVAGVMTAHIVVPAWDDAVPATLSPVALRGVLRERLGFEGVVFTDALEMAAVAAQWRPGEAVAMSLRAGADMPVLTTGTAAYREMVEAVDRAEREGSLDPDELDRSVERLSRLAADFPATPDPSAAWQTGDDELLREAARRGLVAIGVLPRLHAGDRVVLVAAGEVVTSAASQVRASPAEAFGAALASRGVDVVPVGYAAAELTSSAGSSPDERSSPLGAARAQLRAAAAESDAVLFVSTSRTRMRAGEIALARAAADLGRPFCHVALWNPFHAGDVPGPALITFSFAPAAAEAAAGSLLGTTVAGRAPVPLRTADGMTAG